MPGTKRHRQSNDIGHREAGSRLGQSMLIVAAGGQPQRRMLKRASLRAPDVDARSGLSEGRPLPMPLRNPGGPSLISRPGWPECYTAA